MATLGQKLGLNSIQGRLTAIALFFIVATSAIMGVAGFRMTVDYESQQFREHFNLLASYLASNAELGVLLGNQTILEELVSNMLKVTDVQRVEIEDREARPILRRAHPSTDMELESVSAPVFARRMDSGESPFLDEGGETEIIGRVTIAYSLSGLVELKRLLALRFVVISLALAVVPVILYWMLSRAINAPLQELLAVAGAVSRGKMDVRAHKSSLREINTLSGAINEMLDALGMQRQELNRANAAMARQQVLAEVGKFSMTVAHEIKNPLAIIKGSLGILRKEGPVDPRIKAQMTGFVDEEIERINTLIEDFLLFARPRPVARQLIEVGELVEKLSGRVRLMDPRIEVCRRLAVDKRSLELFCDLSLLERALFNVLRNALEASPSGSPVEFQICWQADCLLLIVRDQGTGIDVAALGSIFEPFVSHKSKGTGLGLAIARDVVNAHGGTISAANHPAGGAEFTIALPVGHES